ncbi:hypothetical protein [Sphingomonas sanxanigenens]|uniref:Uncharacterized protein n=1 Tax=Sphingomonas sanxanigenens DSM 19645 = NX02 TaxID=1123269 RepID=W0A843_9SPHN|nr:hypothetical protein [Sphingomonas sanxanigenens]AHE52652.1 hypothetical protein NX02_04540 [Sphingomonas sanxanigenens DSM 19645 = NX02]
MIPAILASSAAQTGWSVFKRFWWAIPMLALFVALLVTRGTLAGVKAERDAEKAAHTQTVVNYRRAAAEAEASDQANARRVETQQKEITDAVSTDYQSQLAAVRARYERLQSASRPDPGGRASPSVPGVPPTAGGSDAAAPQAGLPAADALTATEQALQLQALQEWARRQAAVDVNGER